MAALCRIVKRASRGESAAGEGLQRSARQVAAGLCCCVELASGWRTERPASVRGTRQPSVGGRAFPVPAAGWWRDPRAVLSIKAQQALRIEVTWRRLVRIVAVLD